LKQSYTRLLVTRRSMLMCTTPLTPFQQTKNCQSVNMHLIALTFQAYADYCTALMIHGGSHIIFSRKDIRPAQTRLLLDKGFLPVSLDHRLCPEVRLVDGPMVDICDALDWARNKLPYITLPNEGVRIDGERVVVVGWSSGGQLAMSLAWTAPQRGLPPPEAILAFYCPTNYEDECKLKLHPL
jgi:Esterase/lipase